MGFREILLSPTTLRAPCRAVGLLTRTSSVDSCPIRRSISCTYPSSPVDKIVCGELGSTASLCARPRCCMTARVVADPSSARSLTRTWPSAAQLTSWRSPLMGTHFAWNTLLWCPLCQREQIAPVCQSPSTMCLSSDPEMSLWPVGVKLIVLTHPSCHVCSASSARRLTSARFPRIRFVNLCGDPPAPLRHPSPSSRFCTSSNRLSRSSGTCIAASPGRAASIRHSILATLHSRSLLWSSHSPHTIRPRVAPAAGGPHGRRGALQASSRSLCSASLYARFSAGWISQSLSARFSLLPCSDPLTSKDKVTLFLGPRTPQPNLNYRSPLVPPFSNTPLILSS
jgi:hypothetical protein